MSSTRLSILACAQPSAARPEREILHVRSRRTAQSRSERTAQAFAAGTLAWARYRQRHFLFISPLPAHHGCGRRNRAVFSARDIRLRACRAEPVRSGAASTDEFADLADLDR